MDTALTLLGSGLRIPVDKIANKKRLNGRSLLDDINDALSSKGRRALSTDLNRWGPDTIINTISFNLTAFRALFTNVDEETEKHFNTIVSGILRDLITKRNKSQHQANFAFSDAEIFLSAAWRLLSYADATKEAEEIKFLQRTLTRSTVGEAEMDLIGHFHRYRADRKNLTALARSYYSAVDEVPNLPLLTKQSWLPEKPPNLRDIDDRLRWSAFEPLPEERNFSALGGETYSAFVHRIAPEIELSSDHCYRLVRANTSSDLFELDFGPAQYHQLADTCEAIGFELALWRYNNAAASHPTNEELVLRGPPEAAFEFGSRVGIPGVVAFLLIRNVPGGDVFCLFERDRKRVLQSPGAWDVAPAGTFQPSFYNYAYHDRDFRLERTLFREFGEELLGMEDPLRRPAGSWHDFYDDKRLGPFLDGIGKGWVTTYFLGIGVDPLTLKPDLFVSLVMDAARLPHMKENIFRSNFEGNHVFQPLHELNNWCRDERMVATGAFCLELGRHHLDTLRG